MKLDPKLLEANRETEILSAYIAADRIEASLKENSAAIAELARMMHAYQPEQILFVGSGASYCTLYTGYYYLRTAGSVPVRHFFGPELIADDPPSLRGSRSLAILASYSGKTADTVAAGAYLKDLGVPRIALGREEHSPLAGECEHVLAYHDKCLYTSAMANLLVLLAAYLRLRGEGGPAEELERAVQRIPDQMRGVMDKAEQRAMEDVQRVVEEDFFYVLGDGALWALAYQFGYTNLMEYSRVHAACLRSCEWRHGPLEVLFRAPAMIHFIGNDRSREYALATRDYCAAAGARLVLFDVQDYFPTHPVLAPFVLHPVSQMFVLYQSTARGINMDDYLEMHVKPYRPGETYF